MKKNTLLICAILLSATLLHSQGTWIPKASLGTASNGRSKAASFALNGMGYVGTGYNGTPKNDFWQYDPALNVWTQKANFGGAARLGAIGFAVNGYGYIGTGFATPNYMKDMWRYDATGNSWTQVNDFGGAGRQDAACFVIGNRVYAGTGLTAASTVTNDFWQFNPVSDTWTAKANFSGTARCNSTGFSVGAKGYLCLGRNASGSPTYYNTVYEYDTTANSWTAKSNFSGAAREGACSFFAGGNAYVGTGGSNNLGTLYNDFYRYNATGDTWTAVANFSGSLRSHTSSFSINNRGYVGMGYTGGQVNNLYEYNFCSVTNTVTATPPSCNGGSNGSLNLTVSNATAPYTYVWSNGATTEDISGLAAGNYSVMITDTYGCTSTSTMTMTAPAVLTSTVSSVNVQCNGGSTGSATVTTIGGTPQYTYIWSPGTQTNASATGISAGTHIITVYDANGCFTMNTVTITEPTPLTTSVSSTLSSCAACPDGTASASASGGTSPYSYLWSTGSSSQNNTGLIAGNYTVCVTDSQGCTKCNTANITNGGNAIAEYNPPSISVFPNPSKGEFRVTGLKDQAELSVYNCLGKLVYRTDLLKKQEYVDVSWLEGGVYFLGLKTEDKIFTKKIILTE